jgi:serine/threonine protein kinase
MMWNWFRRRQHFGTVADEHYRQRDGDRSSAAEGIFEPLQDVRGTMTGNHWQIMSLLGTGRMGAVYLVRDENAKTYALKTLLTKTQLVGDPVRLSMLKREATTWVMLDHHPNIVSACWCERIEGVPCIILEYVSGGTLQERLDRGPLDTRLALIYALSLCDAMVYANAKLGLIHRDIKPSNCLIDAQGRLKLGDFGIAQARTGTAFCAPSGGTPGYSAPEQNDPRAIVDSRADIHAFGVTLFAMLTGSDPGPENPPLVRVPRIRRIPKDLRDLILHCIQPLPDHRPANFSVVRLRLAKIYHTICRATPPSPPDTQEPSIDELQNKAVALQTLDLYDAALECYNRALKLSPRDAELWLGKSGVLHLLGSSQEAIRAADQGLMIAPEDADLWHNRGMGKMGIDDLEGALECFTRALLINTMEPLFWRSKGLVLSKLGRIDEALESYDRGIAYGRNDVSLRQHKAQTLVDAGRLDEALQCLSEGIEISPLHAGLYHGLGVVWEKLGHLKEAATAFNKAHRLQPKDPGVQKSRAALLARLGGLDPTQRAPDEALGAQEADFEI